MPICWKSKFDFILSMCFTGNRHRADLLDVELDRVGLKFDIRQWNVPTPFEARMMAGARPSGAMRHAGFRNSTFGHWKAVMTAYELGSERCLIMEDDIRFMKDQDSLEKTFCSMPDSTHDILLLDFQKVAKEDSALIKKALDKNTICEGWSTYENPRSFACYSFNRKAMKWYLDTFEGALAGKWRLYPADAYLRPDFRRERGVSVAIAWMPMTIQRPIGHIGNSGEQIELTKSLGINPDDYAE